MYEDYNHFYLILDLVSGGEMFEHLINYGAYSESDAARIMYEIASALAFMHGVGVVHADLKPENLLLDSKKRIDGVIKMIDFGCAVVYNDDGSGAAHAPSASSNGTTAYWPPERFQKGIIANAAMDMWAVGVILYIMLTGIHPFDISGTSTDDEIEKLIQTNPSPFLGEGFTDHLSQSAVELIQRLMEPDPSKRITAYEMLNHSWVRGETASSVKIEDSDKRLSRFKELRNQLDAGIFSVLVNQGNTSVKISEARPKGRANLTVVSGSEASTNLMKKAFDTFDAEGKGFITSHDIGRVVSQRIGQQLSQRDTRALLKSRKGDDAQEMLSLSDFSALFNGMHMKHFPRGHIIFHIGDTGDAMYFLSSGKVEVLTRKGQLVALLRSGDFFGEGSLLSEENRRFTTARCATPVDVIEIKRADFDR
jgi:serine/threonine protein kinase